MDYHHYTRKCDGMCDSCDCPESVRLHEMLADDEAPKYNSVAAGQLLCIRDAIANKEYDEAYHLLYLIADPSLSSLEPWSEMERIAKAANVKVSSLPQRADGSDTNAA